MTDEVSFTIKGKVWRYPGHAGWYFVNLDRRDSARVRRLPLAKTVAWGYVRVKAKIGVTGWDTTLFPARGGVYMIAIKAVVRKKERIQEGDTVGIKVTVENVPPFPLDRWALTATETGNKRRNGKARSLPTSSRRIAKEGHKITGA